MFELPVDRLRREFVAEHAWFQPDNGTNFLKRESVSLTIFGCRLSLPCTGKGGLRPMGDIQRRLPRPGSTPAATIPSVASFLHNGRTCVKIDCLEVSGFFSGETIAGSIISGVVMVCLAVDPGLSSINVNDALSVKEYRISNLIKIRAWV